MPRKDEFDEIAEWLVFNCSAVREALEDNDDDSLANAIAFVLREENIGYRDPPKATSAVADPAVETNAAPPDAANVERGLGLNHGVSEEGDLRE